MDSLDNQINCFEDATVINEEASPAQQQELVESWDSADIVEEDTEQSAEEDLEEVVLLSDVPNNVLPESLPSLRTLIDNGDESTVRQYLELLWKLMVCNSNYDNIMLLLNFNTIVCLY